MIYCTEIVPPLEIKEIFDFVRCEIPENPVLGQYEGIKKIEDDRNEWEKTDYVTKKRINEEIKKTNAEIEVWMERKRKKTSAFAELYIEDCLEKKRKLKLRLGYVGKIKATDDKDRAKLVPIDSFMKVTGGFVETCPFHKTLGEKSKTPSLKYYPADNHVYCFVCTKRADAIDCLMAKEQIDFTSAVKRLLNK